MIRQMVNTCGRKSGVLLILAFYPSQLNALNGQESHFSVPSTLNPQTQSEENITYAMQDKATFTENVFYIYIVAATPSHLITGSTRSPYLPSVHSPSTMIPCYRPQNLQNCSGLSMHSPIFIPKKDHPACQVVTEAPKTDLWKAARSVL